MVRGPCSSLMVVVDTQAANITKVVFDFADILRDTGFSIMASEDQLALLQQCTASFQTEQGTWHFPGFDLFHPSFQERINFFCLGSEEDLSGPSTALTFAIAFSQFEVLTLRSDLSPTGEAVLVPLTKALALRLAPYLIELDEELDWMTAWEALNRGSSPLGKLLYLSPEALKHPGTRMCRYWGTVEELPNDGLLVRPFLHSWVGLRHSFYPAPEATIVCSETEDGLVTEIYSFDPRTAVDDLFTRQGGITINGITWTGVNHMDQLAGCSLDMSVETEPELCDSVFWHRGETLEIQRLSVTCTTVQDGECRLRLRAVLHDPTGHEVEATAILLARVETRDSP
jgi:hypothetical protein